MTWLPPKPPHDMSHYRFTRQLDTPAIEDCGVPSDGKLSWGMMLLVAVLTAAWVVFTFLELRNTAIG